jgi:hypothetical protein
MIGNALQGTPWNTVHWAVANLYRATDGKHEIFPAVAAAAAGSQLDKQQFFKKAAIALKDNDKQVLARFVTAPSPLHSLSSEDPYYAEMKSLWDAAASAEAVWPSARSANGME